LIVAFIHFVQDERFNDELLLDLLARGSDLWAAPSPSPVLESVAGD